MEQAGGQLRGQCSSFHQLLPRASKAAVCCWWSGGYQERATGCATGPPVLLDMAAAGYQHYRHSTTIASSSLPLSQFAAAHDKSARYFSLLLTPHPTVGEGTPPPAAAAATMATTSVVVLGSSVHRSSGRPPPSPPLQEGEMMIMSSTLPPVVGSSMDAASPSSALVVSRAYIQCPGHMIRPSNTLLCA